MQTTISFPTSSRATEIGRNSSVPGRQLPAEYPGGDDLRPSPPGAGETPGAGEILGPGEILVGVKACGLNHVEPLSGAGARSRPFAQGAPHICSVDAAGTVIATGDSVTRFAVGDEVFGHFPAESWTWGEPPCARTIADGPHIELRPKDLDPLVAAALAHSGLIATTILRAAELRPGQTALVIGATSPTGTMLLWLLAEIGAHVMASGTDAIDYRSADPVVEALTSHPDADLLVDLVSFGEPYFITAAARHGTIVTALPRPDGPGVPRIRISAEPGDLAALAQHALDGPARRARPSQPAREAGQARSASRDSARLPARSRRLIGAAGIA